MPINPQLIDIFPDEHDGYPDDLAAEDTRDALFQAAGDASREFPDSLWIEPREWRERAAHNDRHKLWAADYLGRYTHQGRSHECTCHSLRACFEACRNRQRKLVVGPPESGVRHEASENAEVWVSPLSVYAEANPRQWGGANVRRVMEIAVRRGMLPDRVQPRDWGFRHTLTGTASSGGAGNKNQSAGSWVRLSSFPDGWKETAKHFRPLEVIFPESWEQTVCLVLHGYAVGVGRSGHAVPYTRWHHDDDVMGYTDSYDRVLYDSIRTIRGTVGGSFAIASVTSPDDWSKPAG